MTSPVVIRILKELLDYNHTMPVSYKNALLRELMADEEMGKRLRELDKLKTETQTRCESKAVYDLTEARCIKSVGHEGDHEYRWGL